MSDNRIDYQPTGCVKLNKITIYGMYVLAVILVGMGIYFYISDGMIEILYTLITAAVIVVLMGVMFSKLVWYWNDEKFTVIQPMTKPQTHFFSEIAKVLVDYQSIVLIMNNNKRYMIARTSTGSNEFLQKLQTLVQ